MSSISVNQQVLNKVWDVNTQSWIAMLQPLLNAGSVTLTGTITLPTNAAQETGGNLDSIKTDLDSISNTGNRYTTAFDYDIANNPIYIGMAAQGSSKASAVWLVRNLTFDSNNNVTNILYANGSQAFNQIWNNRASLSYS